MVEQGLPTGILFIVLALMAVVVVVGAAVFFDVSKWVPASILGWAGIGGEGAVQGEVAVGPEVSPTPTPSVRITTRENKGLPSGLVANPVVSITLPVRSVFEEDFTGDEPHMSEAEINQRCDGYGIPANSERCFRLNRLCAQQVPRSRHDQCLREEGYY